MNKPTEAQTKRMEELKDIILNLGYTIQVSSWDRKTLERIAIEYVPLLVFDDGAHLEWVIGEQDVWQLLLGSEYLAIVHAYKGDRAIGFMDFRKGKGAYDPKDNIPIMEFDQRFFGRTDEINNEQELIKLMKQVECPFKR